MQRFLALYMGSHSAEARRLWNALTPAERQQKSDAAMAAWGAWAQRHRAVIKDMGAPLGKTLHAGLSGITPMENAITAYVIVEAESHQAAAEMFKDHPHFAIFPGTGVEILECLPMPGS